MRLLAIGSTATVRRHAPFCSARARRQSQSHPCSHNVKICPWISLITITNARIYAGSSPNCITGVLNWHHGQYTFNTNGSITLSPFGDGYQQIQDPCAAESNFIEGYNFTELYRNWQIFSDPDDGPKLHLFQSDGTPLAPLFQVYSTPNMLPTQLLRNVTPTITDQTGARFVESNSARQWTPGGVTSIVSGAFVVSVASLLL